MPADACAIFGCHVSRSDRYRGIGLFKMKGDPDVKNEWVRIISLERPNDENLKKLIDGDTVRVCERHFNEDEVEYFPFSKQKRLKIGAIPSLNIPSSASQEITTERRVVGKQKTIEHASIDNLVPKALLLSNYWNIQDNTNFESKNIIISTKMDKFVLPKIAVYIDCHIKFTVKVFGWPLNKDHPIYKKYNRTLVYANLENFTEHILNEQSICSGLPVNEYTTKKVKDASNVYRPNILRHSVPLNTEFYSVKLIYRAKDCSILEVNNSNYMCTACQKQLLKATPKAVLEKEGPGILENSESPILEKTNFISSVKTEGYMHKKRTSHMLENQTISVLKEQNITDCETNIEIDQDMHDSNFSEETNYIIQNENGHLSQNHYLLQKQDEQLKDISSIDTDNQLLILIHNN